MEIKKNYNRWLKITSFQARLCEVAEKNVYFSNVSFWAKITVRHCFFSCFTFHGELDLHKVLPKITHLLNTMWLDYKLHLGLTKINEMLRILKNWRYEYLSNIFRILILAYFVSSLRGGCVNERRSKTHLVKNEFYNGIKFSINIYFLPPLYLEGVQRFWEKNLHMSDSLKLK